MRLPRPDPSRLRSPEVVALLAANALPLLGVLALGWSLADVLLLYWAESAVVGAFTVLRMLLAGSAAALVYVPFFCVHYGVFMTVHLVLLVTTFLGDVDAASLRNVGVGALVLAASHGASFMRHDVMRGERRPVEALFLAPYGRIVVMHLTVLLGGFVALLLGSPVGALVLLVALKTLVDLRAHLREREKAAAASTTGTQPA